MSFWMFHTLTNSVYPVPAKTVEEVATLADKLAHRIYFEADLTTQPLVDLDEWWIKQEHQWTKFFIEEEAHEFALEHDLPLYRKVVRPSEVFLIKQETENG